MEAKVAAVSRTLGFFHYAGKWLQADGRRLERLHMPRRREKKRRCNSQTQIRQSHNTAGVEFQHILSYFNRSLVACAHVCELIVGGKKFFELAGMLDCFCLLAFFFLQLDERTQITSVV